MTTRTAAASRQAGLQTPQGAQGAQDTSDDPEGEIIMLRCALNHVYPSIKAGCLQGYHLKFAAQGAVTDAIARLAAAPDDATAAAIGAEIGPVVLTTALVYAFKRDCARLRALGHDTYKAEASLALCLKHDPEKEARQATRRAAGAGERRSW